jgi:hypothetical protein
VCGVILVVGVVGYRRWGWALVASSVAVMLIVQAGMAYGYGKTSEGRSSAWLLANQIWEKRPGARLYAYLPNRSQPQDLSIYMNRIVREVKEPSEVTDEGAVMVTRWKVGRQGVDFGQKWKEIGREMDGNTVWAAYARDGRD